MSHDICDMCLRNDACDNRNRCQEYPILNLGSGLMIRKEWINLDKQVLTHGGRKTDVITRIEDIQEVFKENTFAEVLAFHILEHFYVPDTINIIKTAFRLLRPKGKLIAEGPDILGMYDFYVNKKKDLRGFVYCLMGGDPPAAKLYGEGAYHRSAWTGKMMAEDMEKIGFKIVHVGIGRSHGMGPRDFRVEGVKS